jgi:hypothetical protein
MRIRYLTLLLGSALTTAMLMATGGPAAAWGGGSFGGIGAGSFHGTPAFHGGPGLHGHPGHKGHFALHGIALGAPYTRNARCSRRGGGGGKSDRLVVSRIVRAHGGLVLHAGDRPRGITYSRAGVRVHYGPSFFGFNQR